MLLERLASQSQIRARLSHIDGLSKLPVVLYGAGLSASEIESHLRKRGIHVAGCFVDEAYLRDPHRVAIPVQSWDAVRASNSEFSIVVAQCGDPAQVQERLRSLDGLRSTQVELIDCRFWEAFGSFTREYIKSHADAHEEVYQSLADTRSQATYAAFINAKLLRDPRQLEGLACGGQYFPEDLPAFGLRADDVIVDGGAFVGDTLADVVALSGGKGCLAYHAFEPDSHNARALHTYVCEENLQFVRVDERGLWSEPSKVRFRQGDGVSSAISAAGHSQIDTASIDHCRIPATLVKLDIEGCELEALQGATETIREFGPRLAIAMYHKPEDLTSLPLYLRSLNPDYRFYVRIHSHYSEELVLYATLDEGC